VLHRFKQLIRDFFGLSKAEQYGIIVLVSMILLFSVVYFLLPELVKPDSYTDEAFIERVKLFQKSQQQIHDSIQIEKIQSSGQLDEELARKRLHPFMFDPNKLSDELWLQLGLTEKQIKQIRKYEAKGGKFYVKEDLKKLYCISEAEYKILEPYISIKSLFISSGDEIIRNKLRNTPTYKYTEINRADTSVLKANLKLPYWLGRRVVTYRKKLGGFYSKHQLLEVYGIKEYYYQRMEKYIKVDTTLITKICINQIGFKQLLRHPYCDYNLTKKLFHARDEAGGSFSDKKELLQIINNDPAGLKLLHYLYICPSDLRDN